MVRWSQVSLAAGYLVELRPVAGGVPGGEQFFEGGKIGGNNAM